MASHKSAAEAGGGKGEVWYEVAEAAAAGRTQGKQSGNGDGGVGEGSGGPW